MANPTSLRARAQQPRQQQQQQYVQEERYQEQQWDDTQQDDNFDVALHLASHAQRLKNVDSSLTYFEQSLKNFQAVYVQERNRQNKYLAILGGCIAITVLAVVFWPRGTTNSAAPIQTAQQRIQQQMAAPVAMPQAQQTYAPNFAAMQAPQQPIQQAAPQQMPQIQAPSMRAPSNVVALGARYDQQTGRNTQAYLAAPAQPVYQQPVPVQPRLSPFQITVQNKLSARGEAVPADWQPLFDREARGDKKGKLLVAAKFLKGEGVQRDQAFAVEMIRQAADAGEKEAMMWLAYANQGGNIGKTDINAAIRWFQAAGKAGVSQAYTELGRIYETGADGAPDIETALAWYQRGAQAGDTKAAEAINRLTASQQAAQQPQYAAPVYQAPAPQVPMGASPAQQLQQMIQPMGQGGLGQGAQNNNTNNPNDIFVPAPGQAAQVQQPITPAVAQQIANEIDNSITPAYSATPVVASVPTPAPSTQVGMSKEQASADNKAIQRMLRVLGYKVDRVDGEYGPQTASAIRAYQRDHSVYPDGEPSAELIDALMRDVRGQ